MTNIKIKIKKGDKVIAIAGKDKGKTGEVLKVLPEKNRVIVSGINTAKKHTKPTPMAPGGIIDKDMPIHISNIAVVDPKTEKASRVGYKKLENGEKVRIAKRSGEVIA